MGAELGSIVESMRRYSARSARSPQDVGASPVLNRDAVANVNVRMPKADECYMRLVTAVVQNAFK
jgi:hypothetical protein